MMKKFLLAFVFVLIAGAAHATTWYVDSNLGADTNDGKTTGTAFATLNKATGVMAACDTMYVLPGKGYGGGTGDTFPFNISVSGTSSCQTVYSAYPGTRPIVHGTRGGALIFGVNPLSYVTVNGFELVGWNGALTWAGVSANSTQTALDLYGGGGLQFQGNTGTGNIIHHVVITNMVVHDFPGGGISCDFCDYVTMTGNVSYNNAWYSASAQSGMGLGEQHNIDSGTGTKNFISGNFVYNNFNYVPFHFSTFVTPTASSAVAATTSPVTFNVSSGTSISNGQFVLDVTNGNIPPLTTVTAHSGVSVTLSNGPTGTGIGSGNTLLFGTITDGEGIIMDNNNNSQSDSVPYVGRTAIFNNVLFNNGSAGVECFQSTGCDVYNNTFYRNQQIITLSSQAAGELNNGQATSFNAYNNIFYANSNVPSVWDGASGGATWANNLYFGGNASHAVPGTGNVTGADPLFVAAGLLPPVNFQVSSTSPAIEKGSNTFTRTTDYAGKLGQYGTNPDIGAYSQPCVTFGLATIQSLNTLLATDFASGQHPGSITPKEFRDMIATLSCGRTPWNQ